jgi:hypothetical protein
MYTISGYVTKVWFHLQLMGHMGMIMDENDFKV